ncbi:hypothetical protein Smp_126820 [Schistosoma mansoni]|uniref:hypothetical protein n=1 Tax=Schistosoma mansoni TaxID=6183 RepID=UPI0001A63296|nr:hypothetical protein Smp_126820 [Schistosoma mansoni]|eukprot:XP_018651843.1 hypothetical protein Smp_126820 [Schistosoma mansoni]
MCNFQKRLNGEQYSDRQVDEHNMEFLLGLRFDESVYDEILPVSLISSQDKFWKFYKPLNKVNAGHGFYQKGNVAQIAAPKTYNKRKIHSKPKSCSQELEKFGLKANMNCKKVISKLNSQTRLSEFHFDFLNIPTLMNCKNQSDRYFVDTFDKTSKNYKSECLNFEDLLKFRKVLKEELYSDLFDQTAMKSELKNALFHWATECGIKIIRFSSNEIDNVFHRLNIMDAKIQLQTIVSIGVFEVNPSSEQIAILRGFLFHNNQEIILATCLCLNIIGYSNQTCIEKLNTLIMMDQSLLLKKSSNNKVSSTSLNLLKWASSICLCKLDQCNLKALDILTDLLFDQLIEFIPEQYPNKSYFTQMKELSCSLNKSSDLEDEYMNSFVSILSNLIKFDINKSNIFLNRIIHYSEIKMILRLSRNHDTLTRINRLLLLDWSTMLRIAALHTLETNLKGTNVSLLWSNNLFHDPFLSNDNNSTIMNKIVHDSSITSKSISYRRAQRLYQSAMEGLTHDDLIKQLHFALMDEFSCVREMACVIIEQQNLAAEPVIFNELLKILKNDINDKKSEQVQNVLCHALQSELNSYVRRKILHLLLWFIQTRFITCDTNEHLIDNEIDILAKTSILNEYNSFKPKTIDFNALFDIENEVIEHVLNYENDHVNMDKHHSNLIRKIFIPNDDIFMNNERNQIKLRKLQCNLYYLYDFLRKLLKYEDCKELQCDLSTMIEPLFQQILNKANKTAPENYFYSYDNHSNLLQSLLNEKSNLLLN